MIKCWKCGNTVEPNVGGFCPACGAGLMAAGSSPWAARVSGGGEGPAWALRLIWILFAPLTALGYPIFWIAARRNLARHTMQRLNSPALTSPYVTQNPEGQAVLARLHRAGGASTGVLPFMMTLMLMIVLAAVVFIPPAFAPTPIRYERTMECILEGRSARGYLYVDTPEQYESTWRSISSRKYSRVYVESFWGEYVDEARMRMKYPGAGHWVGYNNDTPERHRPYYYVDDSYSSGQSATVYVRRANAIVVEWSMTEKASIVFYCGLILLYLALVGLGIGYWLRLARHAKAEALAAAYATGDVGYHDRLVPQVASHNGLWIALGIIAAVTQLQLVLFPLLSSLAMSTHLSWEGRTGIGGVLGTGIAPAPQMNPPQGWPQG